MKFCKDWLNNEKRFGVCWILGIKPETVPLSVKTTLKKMTLNFITRANGVDSNIVQL